MIYHSPNSTAANESKLLTLIPEAVNLKCDYTLKPGDFNFLTIDWEYLSTYNSVNHAKFKIIECYRDNFYLNYLAFQQDIRVEMYKLQIFKILS